MADFSFLASRWHLQEDALLLKAFAKLALFQSDVIQSLVNCDHLRAWNGYMHTGDI